VRGVHRQRRCASLYTYCIYELRFSEDAAARRSAAARYVKEFPALLNAVAAGELHLTGLLMIGPHLAHENQLEILGRARFRTKKELAKLVRELKPLPRVPDVVEPLGPAPMKPWRKPTWAEFVESFCPLVRELPPGERPRDWANDGDLETTDTEDALPVGPVPANLPPVTSPQHYQEQFETSEEHVALIERAKALMARGRPGVTLGQLHLEAMKLLVASLEKRRFAVGAAPRQRENATADGSAPPQRGNTPNEARHRASAAPVRHRVSARTQWAMMRHRASASTWPTRTRHRAQVGPRRAKILRCTRALTQQKTVRHRPSAAPHQRENATDNGSAPRQRGTNAAPYRSVSPTADGSVPRRRGRYIPAAVRREVGLRA